jgi:hypothetical protein
VPQIAIETAYLVISNAPFVIDWANESLQLASNRLVDGSILSLSGTLSGIFYNETAGSTYMIYYSDAKGLWTPQPWLQIENATLMTQPVSTTCTTTLHFTLGGPSNAVWNLPMIPAGACYTVNDAFQQQSHTTGNTDLPSWSAVLGSTAAILILAVALVFSRKRKLASAPLFLAHGK